MTFDFELWCGRIAAAMRPLQIPGLAAGVVAGDEEWTAGFGVTSVEHPLPVDADTLFQIGSITKTVTCTAAMRLAERGRLDLDAPLRTYLPQLRLGSEEVAQRITLRDLFTHTGGFTGDFFLDTGDGDDALEKIVARMADLRQWTPLGEVWFYSNSGFYLASRGLEVATGRPFETALHDLVLEPLGMDRSYFFAKEKLPHRFAVGHQAGLAGPTVARPFRPNRAANATGGLVSSLRDVLRYARFHLGDGRSQDGTRLLAPDSLASLQSPLVPAGWPLGDAVGLGWYVEDRGGTRVVRHPGITNGQNALLSLVPERGLAIAVLANGSGALSLLHEATDWALENLAGIARSRADSAHAARVEPDAYLGPYVGPECDVELRLEGTEVVARVTLHETADVAETVSTSPMRVVLAENDTFRLPDAPFEFQGGEFVRRADGRIGWCRLGGHIASRSADS